MEVYLTSQLNTDSLWPCYWQLRISAYQYIHICLNAIRALYVLVIILHFNESYDFLIMVSDTLPYMI